jgi:hypothetical protein
MPIADIPLDLRQSKTTVSAARRTTDLCMTERPLFLEHDRVTLDGGAKGRSVRHSAIMVQTIGK